MQHSDFFRGRQQQMRPGDDYDSYEEDPYPSSHDFRGHQHQRYSDNYGEDLHPSSQQTMDDFGAEDALRGQDRWVLSAFSSEVARLTKLVRIAPWIPPFPTTNMVPSGAGLLRKYSVLHNNFLTEDFAAGDRVDQCQ